jgi:hypothetical protein
MDAVLGLCPIISLNLKEDRTIQQWARKQVSHTFPDGSRKTDSALAPGAKTHVLND